MFSGVHKIDVFERRYADSQAVALYLELFPHVISIGNCAPDRLRSCACLCLRQGFRITHQSVPHVFAPPTHSVQNVTYITALSSDMSKRHQIAYEATRQFNDTAAQPCYVGCIGQHSIRPHPLTEGPFHRRDRTSMYAVGPLLGAP